MKPFRLAQITSGLIGAPYRLGESDKPGVKKGYDCASLILHVADLTGMPMPKTWEGFTVDDYAEFYRRRPEQAQEVLCLWASEAGKEIPASRAFAGDLLIVRPRALGKRALPSVVIHAGQDQVLAVYEDRGVGLAPIRYYTVLKAYRWIKKRKPRLMTPRKWERYLKEND